VDKRTVKTAYKTVYKDPIVLNAGDEVKLGEEEKNEKWKGWIWAETAKYKGWIPVQIVKASENNKRGIVTEYYTAKELDVEKGDEVELIKHLNGWVWSRNLKTGDEGWIPLDVF
jgi:hypothetical protein